MDEVDRVFQTEMKPCESAAGIIRAAGGAKCLTGFLRGHFSREEMQIPPVFSQRVRKQWDGVWLATLWSLGFVIS